MNDYSDDLDNREEDGYFDYAFDKVVGVLE